MKVYLAMYNNKKTLTDRLISFVSRGPYSHCEVIIGDMAYSASVRDGKRVRRKSIKDMKLDSANWDIYYLFDIDPDKCDGFYYWWKTVEYSNYGFCTLIFNHLLRLPIKFEDEYICSEICYKIIKLLGLTPKSDDRYFDKGDWEKEESAHTLTPTSMLAYLMKYMDIGNREKDNSILYKSEN